MTCSVEGRWLKSRAASMPADSDLKFIYLYILYHVIRAEHPKPLSLILQLTSRYQLDVWVRLFLSHVSHVTLWDIGVRLHFTAIQGQAQSESLEGGPKHRYLKASGFDKSMKLAANNDES